MDITIPFSASRVNHVGGAKDRKGNQIQFWDDLIRSVWSMMDKEWGYFLITDP
jgi:hypothetical protein